MWGANLTFSFLSFFSFLQKKKDEAKARGAAVMKDMDGDGDGKLKISGELMGYNGEAIALHAAAEHFNGHFMRFAHDVHNDGKPHPIVGHLGEEKKRKTKEKGGEE